MTKIELFLWCKMFIMKQYQLAKGKQAAIKQIIGCTFV